MILVKLGYQNKAYKMSLKDHRKKLMKKIWSLNSIYNNYKIKKSKINNYKNNLIIFNNPKDNFKLKIIIYKMILVKLGYQKKAYKMTLKVYRNKLIKKICSLNSIYNNYKN